MKKYTRQRPTPQRSARAPTGRIRIIGGQFRRTPIAVVAMPGLRPTPDRVRETVFNWLEHLLGDLRETCALDLFAGTGALGFEMASRGAGRVVLVESNERSAQALRLLRQRLAATAVEVVQADWRTALAQLAGGSFDVIFLDPPYGSGILDSALGAARPLLARAGLIYAEAPKALDAVQLAEQGWDLVRAGKAGGVYFHLLRARSC